MLLIFYLGVTLETDSRLSLVLMFLYTFYTFLNSSKFDITL